MNKDRMDFSSNPFSKLDPRALTLYLRKGKEHAGSSLSGHSKTIGHMPVQAAFRLQLPISLSRGKRFADLIAKLSNDIEEVSATPA